jgi:hypothetical protein
MFLVGCDTPIRTHLSKRRIKEKAFYKRSRLRIVILNKEIRGDKEVGILGMRVAGKDSDTQWCCHEE